MWRRRLILGMMTLALALPFSADYFCKRYDFVQEKYLKLNQKVGDLEILDLRFEIPNQRQGMNRCVASVKNYGSKTIPVNLAMALFDETGNLVGCGATGTKLTGTRPGHVESYYISFDYVRTKIQDTKLFYLTVETGNAP